MIDSLARAHRRELRPAAANMPAGKTPFHWIRILGPREDSNSIRYSSTLVPAGAISSTNAGFAVLRPAARRWERETPADAEHASLSPQVQSMKLRGRRLKPARFSRRSAETA